MRNILRMNVLNEEPQRHACVQAIDNCLRVIWNFNRSNVHVLLSGVRDVGFIFIFCNYCPNVAMSNNPKRSFSYKKKYFFMACTPHLIVLILWHVLQISTIPTNRWPYLLYIHIPYLHSNFQPRDYHEHIENTINYTN